MYLVFVLLVFRLFPMDVRNELLTAIWAIQDADEFLSDVQM